MDLTLRTASLDHTVFTTAKVLRRVRRRDVDGLRSIAVLPVLFYHAGLAPFASGYLGVDIFFVISGYLIAGLMEKDLRRQRFDLVDFYVRRARRVLPALFFMVATVTGLSLLLMGGRELQLSSVGAVTSLLGVSNFYFLWSTNYFATALNISPFIMTWSLGVEEQFYLVFPFVMLVVHRLSGRNAVLAMAGLSLLSFSLCLWLARHHPSAAFYLLPTRLWQIGLGAVLAMSQDRGWLRTSAKTDTVLGAGGLALVLASVTVLASLPHPGPVTLLPVLGTLLLLQATNGAVNRHLLSSTPLVGIGLISYSLYLWHMPLLELIELVHFGKPDPAVQIGTLIASLGIGWLSWRFIEEPFRHHSPGNLKSLGKYAAVIGAGVAVLASLIALNGLPQRLASRSAGVEATIARSRRNPCLVPFGEQSPVRSSACDRPVSGRKAMALLGDSHAAALGSAMAGIADRHGLTLIQAEKAACAPIFGLDQERAGRPLHAQQCKAFNEANFQRLAGDKTVDTVVMTAFWSASDLKPEEAKSPRGADSGSDPTKTTQHFRQALARTVGRYAAAGKRVIVVSDVPLFRFDPAKEAMSDAIPLRAMLRRWLGMPDAVAHGRASRAWIKDTIASDSQVVDAVGAVPAARYFSLAKALCERGCAYAADDGTPYYVDYHHLTEAGAARGLTGLTL